MLSLGHVRYNESISYIIYSNVTYDYVNLNYRVYNYGLHIDLNKSL